MTKEKIAEIRVRCEGNILANYYTRAGNENIWVHVQSDCLQLLNALEAETARADEAEKENKQWNDADCNTCPLRNMECCENACQSKLSMAIALNETLADRDILECENRALEAGRDHWKARVEAFERFVKGNGRHECCVGCLYQKNLGTKAGECQGYTADCWQFDEARFSGVTV
jgi:hypothetical protein